VKQPNFLFFITDQHRADYLGCAGHPVLKTPHIDSLAARGARFDRFFVASPVCMPNRATLLTGRFPSAHGLRQNGNHLSRRATTFVEVLREGGYKTAHIGKSHVQPMTSNPAFPRVDPKTLGILDEAWKDDGGDYGEETPERYAGTSPYAFKLPYYGYDHVDMVTNHGDQAHGHYDQWLRSRSPQAAAWRDRANQLPHDYVCPQAFRTPIPDALYPTAFIRDRAVDWLHGVKNDDQPFFTFVSFPDPHHPFTPPGKYWDLYRPEQFAVKLPYEAHRNPIPPLRWAHDRMLDNTQDTQSQVAFMANERQLKEAMALTCGMIAMIDDAVGAVLDALRDSGRFDDTVVIFNSDHGDYLGDFNLLLKGALPLKSIVNVPFIWSDPAEPHACVRHALASTADLGPTIIERAGLKPYWGIQGTSLLPAIRDDAHPHERLMIEFQDGAPRFGFAQPTFVRSLVTDTHRISLYKGETWGELYDLVNDPDETSNLWDEPSQAATRARLTEQLAQAMMDIVDQSPRAVRRA
jgi:arylsulfatase A-like enzyme